MSIPVRQIHVVQPSRRRVRVVGVAALLVSALVAIACSPPPPPDLTGTQGPYGVAVTRNLKIPLEDGRVLRADLYEPTDQVTGQRADGPFPVIIGMTPYGKSGAGESDTPGSNGVNYELVRNGYMALAVDVPGTGVSDGKFDLFDHAEAIAGAEVVEWASGLPRSTGTVGMIGLSYTAIVQLFTAGEVGPDSPLKAIIPMAATVDPYRDLFTSGGALNLISPLGLLFGYGITRSVTPLTELWNDPFEALSYMEQNFSNMADFEAVMAEHMFQNGDRRYDGDWWTQRRPELVLENIAKNDVAVLLIGGLYDVFQRGKPLIYSGLQNAAAGRSVTAPMDPSIPADPRFELLMGPWTHGNIGEGLDLSQIQLDWFDRWLKGEPADRVHAANSTANPTPFTVIEPDGTTYQTSHYPLTESAVQRWWLGADASLTTNTPDPSTPHGADRIWYSFFGPICTASTVQFAAGIGAEDCLKPTTKPTRSDNEITFTSPPLDAPLQLGGPIGVNLWAKANTQDSLFVITVEDVAADGTSMDITGGAQQGSLRTLDITKSWPSGDDHGDGYIRPYFPLTRDSISWLPQNEPVKYHIEVRPAFATIPEGHQLRIRVSTADFPHLVPLADIAQLEGGVYDILSGPDYPSSVDLSVRTTPR